MLSNHRPLQAPLGTQGLDEHETPTPDPSPCLKTGLSPVTLSRLRAPAVSGALKEKPKGSCSSVSGLGATATQKLVQKVSWGEETPLPQEERTGPTAASHRGCCQSILGTAGSETPERM